MFQRLLSQSRGPFRVALVPHLKLVGRIIESKNRLGKLTGQSKASKASKASRASEF